ncbi:hypothetical protein EDB81DRAFT_17278 [Dactylonectria macrodidyma]|uniref:Uncharacterized protein n=1 Tax=Dactylonectria macrodidyma TaxID=307937 RepID=A0A9P9FSL2_9HYPO|nr:hypothetical protein EDB81DRAFT_17278 [Dactylonectria macrodidyma]
MLWEWNYYPLSGAPNLGASAIASRLRLTLKLRVNDEAFIRADYHAVTRNHAGTNNAKAAGALGRQPRAGSLTQANTRIHVHAQVHTPMSTPTRLTQGPIAHARLLALETDMTTGSLRVCLPRPGRKAAGIRVSLTQCSPFLGHSVVIMGIREGVPRIVKFFMMRFHKPASPPSPPSPVIPPSASRLHAPRSTFPWGAPWFCFIHQCTLQWPRALGLPMSAPLLLLIFGLRPLKNPLAACPEAPQLLSPD